MNEEIGIKLQGGLGNYMFQIACAYAYALNNNKKAIFTIDDSMVGHKHITNYKDNILSNVELIPTKNYNNFSFYKEPNFHYTDIPIINGSVYLDGYFQSEKYFKKQEAEIRKLFSYPDQHLNRLKEKYREYFSNNTCSIHVRRGDYLKFLNHHPTQNMNYYMKAIKQMPKDSIFLIFSDDITWCKENFPDLPEKFKFIENNADYEDLLLMSLCSNNIICNSTFSWWAAWLNQNPNKIVIAPSIWFGPAFSSYDTKDLYCDSWIKI